MFTGRLTGTQFRRGEGEDEKDNCICIKQVSDACVKGNNGIYAVAVRSQQWKDHGLQAHKKSPRGLLTRVGMNSRVSYCYGYYTARNEKCQ